ncbi:MAG: hypothetical protein QNL62_08035, partial [Gammaproteobacteria bacterium]|nr:hypothetical protein [Gammaproteobacteria bacterium]
MNKKNPLITTSSSTVTFLYKVGQKTGEVGQLLAYSLLFSHLSFIPYVHAGPSGGVVVGGAGNISQSGLTTTVNQTTGSMAIDWSSYNLNANERVQYN